MKNTKSKNDNIGECKKKFNSLIPSNSVENFEEFRNFTIILVEYERVIDQHSRNQKK